MGASLRVAGSQSPSLLSSRWRIGSAEEGAKKVLFGKVGYVMVHDASSPEGELALEGARGIPVASMVESIVGCKWSVRLLGQLADGPSRPSALLRACPGLSAKVMNERLRKMTRLGIVRRTVFGDRPPLEVEYVLTPFGCRFMGILEEVRRLQKAVDAVRGGPRRAGRSSRPAGIAAA
jgi:DNA-binding HxlR family transcriptional regulator